MGKKSINKGKKTKVVTAIKASSANQKMGSKSPVGLFDFTLMESDFKDLVGLNVQKDPSSQNAQYGADIVNRAFTYGVPSETSTETVPSKGVDDNEEIIRKSLPKVIANKVEKMVPDGFELTGLSFTGQISGTPFGVGVSGSVTASFTKKTSP